MTTLQVPEALSLPETFSALYHAADVVEQRATFAGKRLCNRNDARIIFESQCDDKYCDIVRGKYMHVGFASFPKLDITGYDKHYGEGAAKKAIDDIFQRAKEGQAPLYDRNNCQPCAISREDWAGECRVTYR